MTTWFPSFVVAEQENENAITARNEATNIALDILNHRRIEAQKPKTSGDTTQLLNPVWSLKFGASLEFGVWSLKLFSIPLCLCGLFRSVLPIYYSTFNPS